MPVPVPRIPKQPAHPVIKQTYATDQQKDAAAVLNTLTGTLPASPAGPPPSFGTREEWIQSLPSWRRSKPRRIWEDDGHVAEGHSEEEFDEGLTVTGNQSVIKGAHAQACIPPLRSLVSERDMSTMHTDADAYKRPRWAARWSEPDVLHAARAARDAMDVDSFSPIAEDSPELVKGNDPASSPLGPVTPFDQFVNRAVAAQVASAYAEVATGPVAPYSQHECHYAHAQATQTMDTYMAEQHEQRQEQAPAPPPVVTPSANEMYKKLAEPISHWMATYVWKVCTTGMSLPPAFARSIGTHVNRYSVEPPQYLAGSVHSILLSTLLQPSALILALYYVVRLPVFFSGAALGVNHVNEMNFRVELLGELREGPERDAMEASAPFKLILLGCMLANKWLDDHTFSNKTWHAISNVPILALNRLENLALMIFHHDLSVPQRQWMQWLGHIASYHASLSSPMHPQPISRPSTNPHAIIRRAIEEIQASSTDLVAPGLLPEPVFVGIEQRRQEKGDALEGAMPEDIDVLEIDLDEDGPLREEYLPRRRVSGAGSARSSFSSRTRAPKLDWERPIDAAMNLPPPAKWSPSGDEPIIPRGRSNSQYVAVQPPMAPVYHNPVPFQQVQNGPRAWLPGNVAVAPKDSVYSYDENRLLSQPAYNHTAAYPYGAPTACAHARSQSYSFDGQGSIGGYHSRALSQTRFEFQCSAIRMTAHDDVSPIDAEAQWKPRGDEFRGAAPFGHLFGAPQQKVSYLPSWGRT